MEDNDQLQQAFLAEFQRLVQVGLPNALNMNFSNDQLASIINTVLPPSNNNAREMHLRFGTNSDSTTIPSAMITNFINGHGLTSDELLCNSDSGHETSSISPSASSTSPAHSLPSRSNSFNNFNGYII